VDAARKTAEGKKLSRDVPLRTAADRSVDFRNPVSSTQQNPPHAMFYAPTTKNSILHFAPPPATHALPKTIADALRPHPN
jgi:hypothetical protein